MFYSNNPIKLAIDRIGGPTKASNLIRVSNGTIHYWIKIGRVPNIDHAKVIAELSGMKLDQVRPV